MMKVKMMGSEYGVIQDDGGGLMTMGNRYDPVFQKKRNIAA